MGSHHSTVVVFKLRAPAARVQFSTPDIFSVAEIQWPLHCLVGGQCRGLIVIRTHPALVKAVLQKKRSLYEQFREWTYFIDCKKITNYQSRQFLYCTFNVFQLFYLVLWNKNKKGHCSPSAPLWGSNPLQSQILQFLHQSLAEMALSLT